MNRATLAGMCLRWFGVLSKSATVFPRRGQVLVRFLLPFSFAFASELSTTWRSSLDRSRDRLRIVDLSEVTSIDRNGEEILRHMIRQGARCLATGIYTRHLLEELQTRTKTENEDR
jgi:hypothetical protein